MQSQHRLGGAGVFSDVSEATALKVKTANTVSAKKTGIIHRTLIVVWRAHSAVTTIPAARRLVGWVNWELLGQGEFVQVCAVKPRNEKTRR